MKFLLIAILSIIQFTSIQSQVAKDMGKLKLVHEFFRNGNRNPLYEKFQSIRNHNPGELTSVGQRQQYELGQIIRKDYIETEKFIPNEYNHQYFHNRGADYNRTLQSATAHAQGIYPLGTGPKAYTDEVDNQDIFNAALRPDQIEKYVEENDFCIENGYATVTVHSEVFEKDSTLLGWDKGCHNIKKQIKKNQQSKEYQKVYEQYKELVDLLNDNLSIVEDIKNFKDLYEVVDDYLALRQNEKSVKNSKIEKKLDELYNVQRDYVNLVYFPNEKNTNLLGQPITEEIITHMESDNYKKTKKRWFMYSTQGPQMVLLMRILNVMNLDCITSDKKCKIQQYPEFASSLILELRDSDKLKKEIVMIRYNGEYIKGVCNKDTNYCTKEEFLDILKKSNKASGDNFDYFCENPVQIVQKENEVVSVFGWIMFSVLISLILLASAALYFLNQKIKRSQFYQSEYSEQKPSVQQELVA